MYQYSTITPEPRVIWIECGGTDIIYCLDQVISVEIDNVENMVTVTPTTGQPRSFSMTVPEIEALNSQLSTLPRPGVVTAAHGTAQPAGEDQQ